MRRADNLLSLRDLVVLTICSTASSLSLASLPRSNLVQPRAAVARSSNVAAFLDADTTKQLQVAGVAMLASFALVASPLPAHAKGGGHGGGHSGGGSHSSHSSRPSYPRSATLSSHHHSSAPSSYSRSSSRRSSRRSGETLSYSSSSHERELRIFPTTAEAREEGGLYCPATLPSVGSKVDIAGVGSATVLESQPALQSGLYDGGARGSQPLPPGFDAGCTLQVEYADGSTDMISAAQEPPSELEEFLGYASIPAYLGLLFWESKASGRYDEYVDQHDRFIKDAVAWGKSAGKESSLAATGLARASTMSGEYWGASAESDEGDQAIRVHLNFERGGRLSGHGNDHADGSYKVTGGRWMVDDRGKVQLGWREKYDEGFVAICFGEYDVATGKIRGRFESSRSVGGSFGLAKKPSVF